MSLSPASRSGRHRNHSNNNVVRVALKQFVPMSAVFMLVSSTSCPNKPFSLALLQPQVSRIHVFDSPHSGPLRRASGRRCVRGGSLVCPSPSHVPKAYLSSTSCPIQQRIRCSTRPDGELKLAVLMDADYASDETTCKSMACCHIYLGQGLIETQSAVVCLSS